MEPGKVKHTLPRGSTRIACFQIHALHSVSSIRLLKIGLEKPDAVERDSLYSNGYTKDVIVCTLHLVDLDDLENHTSYDALSYTWEIYFQYFGAKKMQQMQMHYCDQGTDHMQRHGSSD